MLEKNTFRLYIGKKSLSPTDEQVCLDTGGETLLLIGFKWRKWKSKMLKCASRLIEKRRTIFRSERGDGVLWGLGWMKADINAELMWKNDKDVSGQKERDPRFRNQKDVNKKKKRREKSWEFSSESRTSSSITSCIYVCQPLLTLNLFCRGSAPFPRCLTKWKNPSRMLILWSYEKHGLCILNSRCQH